MLEEKMLNGQSLGSFFDTLGLSNFVVGDTIDWNFVSNEELDNVLIACSYSFTEDQFLPIALEHQNKNGKFVHPVYEPQKGLTYVFNKATWKGDHFDISLTITKDDFIHDGTFPLTMVKEMIAYAKKKRNWLDRLCEHFELF